MICVYFTVLLFTQYRAPRLTHWGAPHRLETTPLRRSRLSGFADQAFLMPCLYRNAFFHDTYRHGRLRTSLKRAHASVPCRYYAEGGGRQGRERLLQLNEIKSHGKCVLLNPFLRWVMLRYHNSELRQASLFRLPDHRLNVVCTGAMVCGGRGQLFPPPPLDFCKKHKNGRKQPDGPNVSNSNLKHLNCSVLPRILQGGRYKTAIHGVNVSF
jgi:hypothetical protein